MADAALFKTENASMQQNAPAKYKTAINNCDISNTSGPESMTTGWPWARGAQEKAPPERLANAG